MNRSLAGRELVHEMRNELAVARANVEAILDGKLAASAERLTSILQALTQLETLINDAQLNVPETVMPVRAATIDVCSLLQHEFEAMEPLARAKRVSVTINRCTTPTQACLHFSGDPTRIGQIVKNVLLNAVRYTPPGGSIDIGCSRQADQLEVRIADSGPGIPRTAKEHIFEAGFRGDAAKGIQGSGLGLAVVKQLVEAQGGSISAADTKPHGTTFVVRLPGTPSAVDTSLCDNCRQSHSSGEHRAP